MWDSLWMGATIATCAESCTDYGLLQNAALAVEAGKIAWIGPVSALKGNPGDLAKQTHYLENALITPGLIDCHTHLVYAGDRCQEFSSRLHGATYEDIARQGGGILSTVRATQRAPFELLYEDSARRLENMISHGVTTVEIKSGYGLNVENEIKQLQVAKALAQAYPVTIHTTFLGLHALPPEYAGRADHYVDAVCEETLPAIAALQLADSVDAFCESIAFSPAQVERFFRAAQALKFNIKIHAEQLSDSKGALLASKYAALSADHLEHLAEDGVRAMAQQGMIAVLLPGAFYFLRDKTPPPIALFRKYKVPMALSTDCNPGTSPVTNLVLMMNMGCVLWRMTPEEALRAVTLHAAKALGIGDHTGSLECHKTADFVVWQLNDPDALSYRIEDSPQKRIVRQGGIVG